MSKIKGLLNKIFKKGNNDLITADEGEEYAKTFVGFNYRFKQRRLELDFSVTEAAIKLDISKTELKLIENGYIGVRKDVKAKIISKYGVDDSFFEGVDSYPTPIKKPVADNFTGSKFHHFISSWKSIIISLILAIGFSSMAVSSVEMGKKLSQDTESFYSEKIKTIRNGIIAQHDGEHLMDESSGSVMSILLADTYYDVNNGKSGKDNMLTSVNVFKSNEHMAFTFLDAKFSSSLPVLNAVSCEIEMRMIDKDLARVHLYVYQNDYKISTLSTDYDWKDFKVNYLYGYNEYGEEVQYSETSIYYQIYLAALRTSFVEFENELTSLFSSTKLSKYNLTYTEFKNELSSSVGNEMGYYKAKNTLLIVGLIFTTIFLMISVFGLLHRFSLPKKMESKISTSEAEDEKLSLESKMVRKLPKNIKIFPLFPECFLKYFSIVVMFVASIGLYTLLDSILKFNVIGAIGTASSYNTVFSLTCVAIILMFFTKLDIFQNDKDSFMINFLLFFGGLLYYFLLLITKTELSYSETFLSKVGNVIFTMLPGNIIWGILSFNLLCAFLFNSYNFKKNSQKKIIVYRSLVIIPILYLIFSVLINVSDKAGWGWNVPFEVKSLFFTKSIIIVLFAILYCFIVFFLRRKVIKTYGLEQAKIYMSGNAYNFKKNLIACLIILILGIIDFICLNYWPTNPLGFGNNSYILLAIPFFLLYRNHLGDRNKKFDLFTNVLYAVSMILGVLLVVGDASNYLSGI